MDKLYVELSRNIPFYYTVIVLVSRDDLAAGCCFSVTIRAARGARRDAAQAGIAQAVTFSRCCTTVTVTVQLTDAGLFPKSLERV